MRLGIEFLLFSAWVIRYNGSHAGLYTFKNPNLQYSREYAHMQP